MSKLFTELGLSGDLLKAIDKLGFEQATPIQAEAIPVLLEGGDVVGQSQTGSGKTVAFAAPAIEKVAVSDNVTQVLILCPTRELAVQVAEEVHKLAVGKRGLHALPIYGGQSYDRQFAGLRQGAHVVIGTPGRVIDHIRRGTLLLNSLKMVVLDEVDVMLNMGFRDDIEFILQGTPTERQTVFFSATIPPPIQQLIQKYGRKPRHIAIEQKAKTVPTVEQVYYEVDRQFKVELLTRLIDYHDLKLGIVFCNTRRMVDDLAEHLNARGYSADRLHGDMTQAMRDRVMNRFRKSGLEFLVATDVAARGIDVENIQAVINYDLPYDGEDYVHRIGRTGRQGRSGLAISFASGREVFQLRNIERYTNTRIHRAKVPTEGEVEAARNNVLFGKIRATLQAGDYKRQDEVVGRLLDEGFNSTDIASVLLHLLQIGESTSASRQGEDQPRPSRPERGGADYGQERRDRSYGPARVVEHPPGGARRRPEGRTEHPKRAGRPEPRRAEIVRTPKLPEVAGVPAAPESAVPSVAEEKSQQEAAPRKPIPAEVPPRKASRRTIESHARLYVNVGAQMGLTEEDLVGTILGHTGLPRKVVGPVDIRDRHAFVTVASEHAKSIIAKLNRTEIKGHRAKVKVA